MKILLSAYACEPNRGSEPGVGWNWAIELAALGHQVWVITRHNSRAPIEKALGHLPQRENLHFLYYDLPSWARWWKKGGRGVHLYYLLWQVGAFRMARRAHRAEGFELVHHVTFVSARQPSFMGGLKIPFIFGPVAGGERCSWRLRGGYGVRGHLLEAARDLSNLLVKVDPLMRYTFSKAARIYVTSQQSADLLPARLRTKASVQLAIGVQEPVTSVRKQGASDSFRVLYVGRFLYWKGMHLGLEAFARLLQRAPHARLTLVGQGPDGERWRAQAQRLGIGDAIDWIPWIRQEELRYLYAGHDLFLFPSLHDSGGMVVLEALGLGLPVVCLDIGGPGVIVDSTCGRAVGATDRTREQVVGDLAEALLALYLDRELRQELAGGALKRVHAFTWSGSVAAVYQPLLQKDGLPAPVCSIPEEPARCAS